GTAVAAVRPALGDELLAAEPDAPVAAVAGDDLDLCFVYEFHGLGWYRVAGCHSRERGNPGRRGWIPAYAGMTGQRPETRSPASGGASSSDRRRAPYSATTFTVRRFFGPLVVNSTLPSTSANSVWSRPKPTPSPGWNWVPRWRTMMLPASMAWPP